MPKQRRFSGDEAAESLSNWRKDSKTAERLAANILNLVGFIEIDLSHPMGGPDNKSDILCKKENIIYSVGVYFPRTQQRFAKIKEKFLADFGGIIKNNAERFIFFTNQQITKSERKKLKAACRDEKTEIFHLENIATILNTPIGFGARLEFLDIELSKSEQLSYFANKDKELQHIKDQLSELLLLLNEGKDFSNIPSYKMKEFKETLESVVGEKNSIFLYGSSMIDRLKVPLHELREFKTILYSLAEAGMVYGNAPIQRLEVPLQKLEDFKHILYEIVGRDGIVFQATPIQKLHVPVEDLVKYNKILNETIEKLKEIKKLKINGATEE